MPRGRPIDSETRARAIALAKEGMGRNAIARELGIGAATVTAIVEPEGIMFDWSTTDLATAARRVQLAEIRTDLAMAALLRAGEALEAMSSPTIRVDFSPASEHRAAEYHEHVMDGPTISDQRNLATTFGILTQRAVDLLRTPGGVSPEAASVLSGLGEALQVVAAELEASAGPDDDPSREPAKITREEMIADLERQIAAETEQDPDTGGAS